MAQPPFLFQSKRQSPYYSPVSETANKLLTDHTDLTPHNRIILQHASFLTCQMGTLTDAALDNRCALINDPAKGLQLVIQLEPGNMNLLKGDIPPYNAAAKALNDDLLKIGLPAPFTGDDRATEAISALEEKIRRLRTPILTGDMTTARQRRSSSAPPRRTRDDNTAKPKPQPTPKPPAEPKVQYLKPGEGEFVDFKGGEQVIVKYSDKVSVADTKLRALIKQARSKGQSALNVIRNAPTPEQAADAYRQARKDIVGLVSALVESDPKYKFAVSRLNVILTETMYKAASAIIKEGDMLMRNGVIFTAEKIAEKKARAAQKAQTQSSEPAPASTTTQVVIPPPQAPLPQRVRDPPATPSSSENAKPASSPETKPKSTSVAKGTPLL